MERDGKGGADPINVGQELSLQPLSGRLGFQAAYPIHPALLPWACHGSPCVSSLV